VPTPLLHHPPDRGRLYPAFVQTQAGHAYASVTSVYTSVGDDFKQKTIQKMIARRIA